MLVNCVVYRGGRKLADISPEEISDFVAQPGCFVWVALKDPEETELAEMQEEFGLHPLAVEDAHKGRQRPKIEEYGDTLFVVLHVLERDGEKVETGQLAIFAGANYVLSVRQGGVRSFTMVRERAEREPELMKNGPGFVLYALMDEVVDRYFPVIEAIEEDLEHIEDRILVRRASRTTIEALYRLKRRLMHIRHSTGPLLEGMARLMGSRSPKLAAGMHDYYRDVFDHLSRIGQQIEAIREMQATAVQVNLALISLGQSEVAKRLAGWAAIIAVPTMIAGLYGMNFDYMPELRSPLGYPLALLAMVAIDVVLYLRFRQAGWL